MPIRGEENTGHAILQAQRYPRLPGQRKEKISRPPKQFSKIDRRALRLRLAVEVQDVVHRGGQGAQSGLHLLDPVTAFHGQLRFREKSGKQFEAAQRIAHFMRQHRRHFRQRLLAAESFLRCFETLAFTDVAENEH
jgi:hypothetical protein